jgi:hypothetical protein
LIVQIADPDLVGAKGIGRIVARRRLPIALPKR